MMKNLIVFALVCTAINSSFLRELATEITISQISFNDVTCAESASAAALKLTVTGNEAVSGTTAVFKATLSSGVTANDITDDTGAPAAASNKIEWAAITIKDKKTGFYKLTKIEGKAGNTNEYTFKLPDPNTVGLIVTVPVEAGTQVADQEVVDGDSTKNSFKIVFKTELTNVGGPVIFSDNEGKKPIADCTVDSSAKTNLICKPKKEEMGKSGEYTLYYQNGCDAGKLVTTNCKIKYTTDKEDSSTDTTDEEDSSAFMKIGKLALIALAILF